MRFSCPRPIPLTLALVIATLGFSGSSALAGKKKYHYAITKVIPNAAIKADLAKTITPRIEAQVQKAFESHPQLVAKLDGAPDPKDKPDAYRAYLAKKAVSGSYNVTVDVTEATEELVPIDGKANSQRLVIHVALHMLGENIPSMTMGFSGDGHATIKQEVGRKVRDKDREVSWDEAAKLAVDDAIAESLKQLALPPKTSTKKK